MPEFPEPTNGAGATNAMADFRRARSHDVLAPGTHKCGQTTGGADRIFHDWEVGLHGSGNVQGILGEAVAESVMAKTAARTKAKTKSKTAPKAQSKSRRTTRAKKRNSKKGVVAKIAGSIISSVASVMPSGSRKSKGKKKR
jgi:hypothetical protein